MSSDRWKSKNATKQSFGGEHHFSCMLDTINGEFRTNDYYTGLCRENLLYTPTFEKTWEGLTFSMKKSKLKNKIQKKKTW